MAFWKEVRKFFEIPFVGLKWIWKELAPDVPKPPAVEHPVSAESRSFEAETSQMEGLAKPRFYGECQRHGNIIAQWTDIAGSGRERLYTILDLGEGPIEEIGNVYINDQLSSKYPGVSVVKRLGTMSQTVMSGFEKTKLEYTQNTELKEDIPIYFLTPNSFFDDIEFTLSLPDGLWGQYDDGSLFKNWITFEVKIREYPDGEWVTLLDTYYEECTYKPHFYLYKASELGFEIERGKQYQLKFTKTETLSHAGGDRLDLRSIREVVDTSFVRSGKTLVGVRIKATDRLHGKMDFKVNVKGRIINTYNGEVWTLQYSNNRAWVVWDILTQPIIEGDSPET